MSTDLATLTPAELRERVARVLGWQKWQDEMGDGYIWTPPGRHTAGEAKYTPPDYPADLNACAEMERALVEGQRQEYALELGVALGVPLGEGDYLPQELVARLVTATAEQRCRAFLAVMEARP